MKGFLLQLLRLGLLYVFFFLLIEGCSYLSGANDARRLQEKQLVRAGFPEKTILIDRFKSGKDFSRSWLDITYRIKLSYEEVIAFYDDRLSRLGWSKRQYKNKNRYRIFWDKKNYVFTLIFIDLPKEAFHQQIENIQIERKSELTFLVKTEWKKGNLRF